MKSKVLVDLQRINKELSIGSWDLYRELMVRLCQDHVQYPGVSSLLGAIRANDISKLLELSDSFESQLYGSATEHFVANQFSALIKKFPFPPDLINLDPEKKAYEAFLLSEHRCKRQNQRFRAFNKRSPNELMYAKMRSFIHYVLGSAPKLESVWRECGFGPGANIGCGGNATSVARKLLAKRWTVTPGAFSYGEAAMSAHAQIFELLAHDESNAFYSADRSLVSSRYRERTSIVLHNKLTFVPKTVKTHRVIAVEPLVNSFLQKGIDQIMRRKLLRIGIDLSDQTKNSEYARKGSLLGSPDSFCTIDLSSASDSISIGLVQWLLPSEWFEFLCSVRSPNFLFNGEEFPYEKFCSMGNGFCFPLETLLFCACCAACGAGTPGLDFLVYGDDIVVRSSVANEVLSLLRDMGFRQNSKKTFLQGPFRESCGRDWFNGIDVRPFILDFRLDSLESLFKWHNLTLRNDLTKSFFEPTREFIRAKVPPRLRFVRPFVGPSNTAFEVEHDCFISSPFAIWVKTRWCWKWTELLHSAVEDSGLRYAKSYNLALLYGALVGVSSTLPFAVRRRTRTKVRLISHSGSTSLWLPAVAMR